MSYLNWKLHTESYSWHIRVCIYCKTNGQKNLFCKSLSVNLKYLKRSLYYELRSVNSYLIFLFYLLKQTRNIRFSPVWRPASLSDSGCSLRPSLWAAVACLCTAEGPLFLAPCASGQIRKALKKKIIKGWKWNNETTEGRKKERKQWN